MALSGSISGAYRGYTLKADWSATQNASGNYSDVTVKHTLVIAPGYTLKIAERKNSCSVDGVVQSYTSGSISQKGGSVLLGTTVHRVYHNADGSKTCRLSDTFNINATIDGTKVQNIIASGTFELSRIVRNAEILSANDFTDVSNPTFSYSNPASFSCDAILEYSGGTITRAGAVKQTGGSYQFILTDSERETLRTASKDTSALVVTYALRTTIDGTAYYSRVSRRMTVVDALPDIGAISYKDTNAATVAVTGDNQRIVQGKSVMAVTFPTATAKKGASIVGYTITFGGMTKQATASGTVSLGTVDVSYSQALTVTARDSRGYEATQSVNVTVDDYMAPTAVIDLHRLNNFEPEAYITASARYSYLNGKNAVSISAKFKRVSDSSYGTPIELEDSIQSTVTCDRDSAYDFVVTVADKLETTDYNLALGKGIPSFFIDTKKSSVGVNCLPTQENALQLSDAAWLTAQGAYPVGSIYMSVTNVNPATLFGGTWEAIGGRFLVGADSTYSAGSTGGEATHKLTTSEMPRHNHTLDNYNTAAGNTTAYMTVQAQAKVGYNGNVQTLYTGGDGSHNNLPPYLAVYMWKRTA